ncbi:SUN domain-containing ossification factor [Trichonephila inaurata madagascariensis]|uniref:SUN domain-containing ossification factor n=1 Tax=Trichonephila inaurata madagascariensis TaxID=2747483 RepID=A0A8X7CIR4_9ARAC|nr:SUN domain-containing ossification factor [Trichonephila inaurata madagascariensis]
MHKSLFRLLHRWDQCISKRIRYYSSAQPHCRFFQATFGPIIFQGLCDWFKEHPLVFTHESSVHSNKASPQDDSSVIPTKSPPPHILIVPLENDSPVKKLLMNANHSVAASSSDKIPLINATKPIPTIIMITIMYLCARRISSSAGQEPYVRKETLSPRIFKRRSSVDSLSPPVARKVKKRSASEEALNAQDKYSLNGGQD